MNTTAPVAFPPIPGSEPLIRNVETAAAYWLMDVLWIVLVDGRDTGGRFSMMEQLLPKGSGPGPHTHTWSDETFYILDGELTLLIGDETRTARKGDFIFVPRSTRHAFRVDSDTARFLNGYTPASMEALIVELATPASGRTLPPRDAVAPPAMNPALASSLRHGRRARPGPAATGWAVSLFQRSAHRRSCTIPSAGSPERGRFTRAIIRLDSMWQTKPPRHRPVGTAPTRSSMSLHSL
jgi:quercetin dioxygenase-like cupin family protein